MVSQADREARELLRRRKAEESLVGYSRYTFPEFRPADHHWEIAEKLEAIESGRSKRVMIFMPPRHGKSELASRRFPSWFIGKNPKRDIIAASYNSDLAGDFGREVRNIVGSPGHRVLFPRGALSRDSKASDRWHTISGGGYAAAGVGTAVTGRGAHVFLIDDPFKDREAADSETNRNRVYGWYMSTAYTRLEGDVARDPNDPDAYLWEDEGEAIEEGERFEGAIVLIQTRWHEDDLAGRLLRDAEKGGDEWEVLSLPAIREEEGKTYALWPQKYPLPRMEQIKSTLPAREWNALYQQQPVPEDGTYFKRGWFLKHDTAPKDLSIVITSDFAVSDDENADFTDFGVWGLNADQGAYLLDWWSGKETAAVWIENAIHLMQKWRPSVFFGESGVIRRAIEPILRRRMRERKVFCRLEWLTRTGDKAAMARGFQGRAEMGMISFPETDFAEDVMKQLLQFPAGLHDDKVDTCALLGMALDKAHPALTYVPSASPTAHMDDYGVVNDEESNVVAWKTA